MSSVAKLTKFFRTKSNEDKVFKLLKYVTQDEENDLRIHYDDKSKFWWVRTEADLYRDYFPCGWWVRADLFFLGYYELFCDDDKLKKMLDKYGILDDLKYIED